MLKKYKKKNGYGYGIRKYDNDIIKYYLINLCHHGYFISRDISKSDFWCKGYYNKEERNSHWLEYHWWNNKYSLNYYL